MIEYFKNSETISSTNPTSKKVGWIVHFKIKFWKYFKYKSYIGKGWLDRTFQNSNFKKFCTIKHSIKIHYFKKKDSLARLTILKTILVRKSLFLVSTIQTKYKKRFRIKRVRQTKILAFFFVQFFYQLSIFRLKIKRAGHTKMLVYLFRSKNLPAHIIKWLRKCKTMKIYQVFSKKSRTSRNRMAGNANIMHSTLIKVRTNR